MRLEKGAIALIDALGFREMVASGVNLGEMLGALTKVQKLVREERGRLASGRVTFRFMSDSILLGVRESDVRAPIYPGHDAESPSFAALEAVVRCVYALIRYSATMPYPMAYRGCITYGDFAIANNYVLGNAVNEAAGMYELADAALVWLTPSAMQVFSQSARPSRDPTFVEFPVPFKGGRTYRTRCVGPFLSGLGKDRPRILEGLINSFEHGRASSDLGVQIKKQNTMAFLAKAMNESGHPEVMTQFLLNRTELAVLASQPDNQGM